MHSALHQQTIPGAESQLCSWYGQKVFSKLPWRKPLYFGTILQKEERASDLESIFYRHSCSPVSFYKCCGSAGFIVDLKKSVERVYLWQGPHHARSSADPGEPIPRCTWSRSEWQGSSGRWGSRACSSRYKHHQAPPGSVAGGRRRPQEVDVLQWPHALHLWKQARENFRDRLCLFRCLKPFSSAKR